MDFLSLSVNIKVFNNRVTFFSLQRPVVFLQNADKGYFYVSVRMLPGEIRKL